MKESYSALGSESILIPRRSPEERKKNFIIATNKKIKEYMKNGGVGDLDLEGTPITSLPEGLIVGGDLDLYKTSITSLPKGLKVGGYLDLYGTFITSLSEGLTVGSWLDLSKTPLSKKNSSKELKRMAPGVKGHIILRNESQKNWAWVYLDGSATISYTV